MGDLGEKFNAFRFLCELVDFQRVDFFVLLMLQIIHTVFEILIELLLVAIPGQVDVLESTHPMVVVPSNPILVAEWTFLLPPSLENGKVVVQYLILFLLDVFPSIVADTVQHILAFL